jgi:putative FmdB family regulatory protein
MPIYEYACKECGHIFDVLQKIHDDPPKDCPECGETGLKKLLSAPNFRLKGGGWYETDFKKDKKRNLADDPGAKSAADGEKKSDDKPDKKDSSTKSADSPSTGTGTEKTSAPAGKSDG